MRPGDCVADDAERAELTLQVDRFIQRERPLPFDRERAEGRRRRRPRVIVLMALIMIVLAAVLLWR